MLLTVHGLPEVLTSAETWLLHAATLGYAAAAILSLLGLFWPGRFAISSTLVVGGLTAAALVVYFAMRFSSDGVTPLANAFEVLVLVSLVLVLVFFAGMLIRPRPALSAWVFPAAFLTVLVALPLASTAGPGSVGSGERARMSDPLLVAHILTVVLAAAQFAFAAIVSVVYLLQDRALRQKRHNRVLASLPSVDTLRGMISFGMNTGFPLLTLSLVCGFVPILDHAAEWLQSPLVISSLVMWLVYLAAALGGYTGWLRGRRIAWTVLLGFLMVIVTFFGTGMLPGKHSFAEAVPVGSAPVEAVRSN